MSTHARNTLRRALPPLLLAAAGAWLLVGCIYVPTFNTVVSGKDVSPRVGGERSKRPLRVGGATRSDVVRVLGEPKLVSNDGLRVAYPWTVMKAVMVSICFPALPHQETRALVLTFDERDTLVSYEITHEGWGLRLDPTPGAPELPWDFYNPNGGEAPPTTRPAAAT